MEKNLKATEVKDEALKQSFAEIKKAANSEQPAAKKTGTKAEVKTEAKPEAKTAVKAAAEKKPVEKKPVEKKPVEKKPVEKKAETKPAAKKAAEKKAEEKKPVEKKPVEKKAAPKAEVSTFVTLQINNQDYDPAKLQEEAIAAARKIKADVASVDVYINVAESAAYYTIDGEGSSDYRIDL
ncbi:MAG: hypothetical protein E7232_02620 [Lachnospiraceae bacterium]|nr:hypothetical protein [Lachnospiraceae bacterium]